jgi:hypothetical protein
MRKLIPLTVLLLAWAPEARSSDVPELGAVYIGLSYTTNSSNYPERENDLFPGGTISTSFPIPHTTLQYDYEDSWHEWRITPIYWDITAMLTYANDNDLEYTLLSSGILGHYIYGRNFFSGDRWRAGFGTGIGEYGIETEAMEAGYDFTWDLAAKVDVLLTDSMVGRFRGRYDIPIGSLTDRWSEIKDKKRPHYLSLDFMLLTSSKLFLGIEYWKVRGRNSDKNKAIVWEGVASQYQQHFSEAAPATPPDIAISRIFLNVGFKFYSIDDW